MKSAITPPVEQVVTLEMTVREAQVLQSFLVAHSKWEADETAVEFDFMGRDFNKFAYADMRNAICNELRVVLK